MQKFRVSDEGFERHACESRRDGDWFIFTCPDCDYQRKFNRKTHEMKVTGGTPGVLHHGQHIPVGLNPRLLNFN